MEMRTFFLVALGVGALSIAGSAADWPQWRGPQRDGISKETGLLPEWPKDGPKLLWQVKDVGDGFSTPSVVGDRIYALGNKGMEDEFVEALDVKDGITVWSKHIGKVGPNQRVNYPGARSTPTVDGEFLYALGSDGDLACLTTAKGEVQWAKSLRRDFGGNPGFWAYAESPLIDGDVLVCTPGGKEATLIALNKKTGDVVWKCPTPNGDDAAYASIIVVEVGGVKQYVQFLQNGLVGVDAKTGKLLWSYDQTAKGSMANIPTPVAHDGFIYSAAGMTGGGLVKLNTDKGEVKADPVYFDRSLPNAIGGSVQIGDCLYGANQANGLECIDFASGKIRWKEPSLGAGSVCCADGRLYFHGEDGMTALVELTPEGYHEKGRFTPPDAPKHPDKAKAWAYPVVADGRLYVRDFGVLWCYDIRDAKASK
ncbi:MAG TPA: PQQ-binding-like beta-propeller repeat protein [Gemmataceae bacterium]|nr:PQQ-binding-like beta-propeller repeat protein [Gemmataceae bacterium]